MRQDRWNATPSSNKEQKFKYKIKNLSWSRQTKGIYFGEIYWPTKNACRPKVALSSPAFLGGPLGRKNKSPVEIKKFRNVWPNQLCIRASYTSYKSRKPNRAYNTHIFVHVNATPERVYRSRKLTLYFYEYIFFYIPVRFWKQNSSNGKRYRIKERNRLTV